MDKLTKTCIGGAMYRIKHLAAAAGLAVASVAFAGPINVDGQWNRISWQALGDVYENPITFTCQAGGCRIEVVDAFNCGDEFAVYRDQTLFGNTGPLTTCVNQQESLPDIAWTQPTTFAQATFTLASGSHTINIRTISDPFSGGAGFVRVIQLALPTPSQIPSIDIMSVGDTQVGVSWTAPNDNGDAVTKYTVTGVPGGSCTTEVVPPTTTPATSCTVTGLTNGTPYKFTVVATNANGDSAPSPESAEAIPSADLMFVGAGPNITLASGVVAAAYSQPLQVVGGLPPYTFSVVGELPPGLGLDTDTGIISGTPTTPGTYSFSVMAIDSAVQPTLALKAVHVAEQTFTIVITAAPVPQASVACAPSELTDSANQVSTCTVTLSPAPTQATSINLVLPAGSPRYSTSCVSPITIAANETTATCTITATENTVAGDGNVTAELSIAPPTVADAYSVSGSPAQVVIKDDDKPAVAAATPVPTLGDIGLLLLSGLIAGSMGFMRRRKSN